MAVRRKKKAKNLVAKATAATGTNGLDALAAVLKVKALATEVGGMKKLKALAEALSE